MNRFVEVKAPSFPAAKKNCILTVEHKKTWQVLCGDSNHWRTGIYSPSTSSVDEIQELENHSCPELFLLTEGELTLVIEGKNGLKKLKLEKGKPVFIDTWHSGYCPKGPYTGKAFVVERTEFITEYKSVKRLT